MATKTLIFPKFAKGAKVELRFGQDVTIGTIIKIIVAPEGHIARKPGSLIYLIQIETFKGKKALSKIVTTAGEEEITPI
jgi:hypothetical protein